MFADGSHIRRAWLLGVHADYICLLSAPGHRAGVHCCSPGRLLPTCQPPTSFVVTGDQVGLARAATRSPGPAPGQDLRGRRPPRTGILLRRLSRCTSPLSATNMRRPKRFSMVLQVFSTPDAQPLGDLLGAGLLGGRRLRRRRVAGVRLLQAMAEARIDGQPEIHVWHMDLKRFGRHYRSQRYTLTTRACPSTTTSSTRPRSARARDRSGSPSRTPGSLRATPRSARRPAGSASTGSRATRPTATRRCDRAAGPGRCGRRPSAPGAGHAPRRRHLRPVELLQARGARAGRDGVPRAARSQRDQPARRLDRLHAAPEPARRHRVRPVGDPPRSRPLPARHGHGVRRPRPRVDRAPPARRRLRARARRDVGAGLLLRLGPAGARRPAAADAREPRQRRFPLPHRPRADRRQRAAAGRARDVRRRAGLELYAPTEYALGLWDAIWRRAPSTA